MNNSFNLLDFRDLDDLLHNLLDWDNLRNLDDSLHYFLNYLLDLDNFRVNSEDLQNIVDVNNVKDLFSDHFDNTFVELQDLTSLNSESLELFKQSLDKNSQMELNSRMLITSERINIIHSYFLWNILHNLNNPIDIPTNNESIDDCFIKELKNISIYISFEIRVFSNKCSQLN